jgi:hypothetical protein
MSEVVDELQELAAPLIGYEVFKVTGRWHDRLDLIGGHSFKSHFVSNLLAEAEEVAVSLCTVGEGPEQRVGYYLSKGNPTRGVMLDEACNAALRLLGRKLRELILELAMDNGIKAGLPLWPGHDNWPLEQQKVIFDLLQGDKMGIRLTDSYIMLPLKTISIIMGLGKSVTTEGSQCDYCASREKCSDRHWVGEELRLSAAVGSVQRIEKGEAHG